MVAASKAGQASLEESDDGDDDDDLFSDSLARFCRLMVSDDMSDDVMGKLNLHFNFI